MVRKNPGWYHEPIRHGLSSKGIETTANADAPRADKGKLTVDNVSEDEVEVSSQYRFNVKFDEVRVEEGVYFDLYNDGKKIAVYNHVIEDFIVEHDKVKVRMYLSKDERNALKYGINSVNPGAW